MNNPAVADNKALVAGCIDIVLNQGKLVRAAEFFHANIRRHHERNPDADLHGLEAVRDRLADLRRVEPDSQVEIVRMFGERDRVMVHLRSRGGTRPWTATALARIADGRIAEIWLIADTLGLLQQQGVVRRFG